MSVRVVQDGKETLIVGTAGSGRVSKAIELAADRAMSGYTVHFQTSAIVAGDFMSIANSLGLAHKVSGIIFTHTAVPVITSMFKDGDVAVFDFGAASPVNQALRSCTVNLKEIIITYQEPAEGK